MKFFLDKKSQFVLIILFQSVITNPSKRDTQSQCSLKICDEKKPCEQGLVIKIHK